MLALEVAGERGELVPALLQRDAALEAAAHDQPAIVAVLEEILVRAGGKAASHGQRHVEVGAYEDLHTGEGLGSDPDHGEVHAVEPDRLADDGRVARQLVLPEVGPQHHDTLPGCGTG